MRFRSVWSAGAGFAVAHRTANLRNADENPSVVTPRDGQASVDCNGLDASIEKNRPEGPRGEKRPPTKSPNAEAARKSSEARARYVAATGRKRWIAVPPPPS